MSSFEIFRHTITRVDPPEVDFSFSYRARFIRIGRRLTWSRVAARANAQIERAARRAGVERDFVKAGGTGKSVVYSRFFVLVNIRGNLKTQEIH